MFYTFRDILSTFPLKESQVPISNSINNNSSSTNTNTINNALSKQKMLLSMLNTERNLLAELKTNGANRIRVLKKFFNDAKIFLNQNIPVKSEISFIFDDTPCELNARILGIMISEDKKSIKIINPALYTLLEKYAPDSPEKVKKLEENLINITFKTDLKIKLLTITINNEHVRLRSLVHILNNITVSAYTISNKNLAEMEEFYSFLNNNFNQNYGISIQPFLENTPPSITMTVLDKARFDMFQRELIDFTSSLQEKGISSASFFNPPKTSSSNKENLSTSRQEITKNYPRNSNTVDPGELTKKYILKNETEIVNLWIAYRIGSMIEKGTTKQDILTLNNFLVEHNRDKVILLKNIISNDIDELGASNLGIKFTVDNTVIEITDPNTYDLFIGALQNSIPHQYDKPVENPRNKIFNLWLRNKLVLFKDVVDIETLSSLQQELQKQVSSDSSIIRVDPKMQNFIRDNFDEHCGISIEYSPTDEILTIKIVDSDRCKLFLSVLTEIVALKNRSKKRGGEENHDKVGHAKNTKNRFS